MEYLRESDIEKHMTQSIKQMGGECLKWESKRTAGLPDRVVLYNGKAYFVELKTERGKLSDGQIAMHERFRRTGNPVITLYGMDQVKTFLNHLSGA